MGPQNSGNFFITEEFSSSFVLDRKIKCFQCELVVGLCDQIPVQEMAPNSFCEPNFILRVLPCTTTLSVWSTKHECNRRKINNTW
jgi:hypothetical protein